jgi:hypothetical protein
VSNLSIANVLLFVTILCLAGSLQTGNMHNLFFSMVGVVLAAMFRHTELANRSGRANRRR